MQISRWRSVAAAVTVVLAGCSSVDRKVEDSVPSGSGAALPALTKPARAPTVGVAAQSRQCVALAMYWEARGEGEDGMLAVGSVIRNRVSDPRFPSTYCGVVHQGGETPPCQFSWWCDGKSDRPTDAALWATAQSLAERMLVDPPPDATAGALFFHNVGMRSPWRRQHTATIGNHVFYR